MATFEEQVEGLTGISILSTTNPTQDELTQFLRDGVIDVTNRCIKDKPQEKLLFQDVTAEQTSQGANLNGADIIAVVRESGTNDDWRNCRFILPNMQGRVVDIDSLNFASKFNPAYTVLEDGKINVYPAPGSDPDAYKIYYVNNTPQNASGSALLYSHSDLKSFPDDKVYLVSIYAAIKTLESKMAEFAIDEEDSEMVQGVLANLNSLKQQYEIAFQSMKAPQSQQTGGR